MESGDTDWFDIGVGVRQGCVLSPLLFDLFIDSMAREAKALGLGVDVGGQLVAILLYADDVVLLAKSQEDLQKLLDAVAAFFRRWRLEVNLSKTKVMAFGVRALGSVQVRWGRALVEEVDEYRYLGLLLEKASGRKKRRRCCARRGWSRAWPGGWYFGWATCQSRAWIAYGRLLSGLIWSMVLK